MGIEQIRIEASSQQIKVFDPTGDFDTIHFSQFSLEEMQVILSFTTLIQNKQEENEK